MRGSKVELIQDASDAQVETSQLHAKVFLNLMEGKYFGNAVATSMAAGLVPIVHASVQKEISPIAWQYSKYEQIPGLMEKALHSWSPDTLRNLWASSISDSQRK